MILPVSVLTLFAAVIPVIAAQDTRTQSSTGDFGVEKTVLSDTDVTKYPEIQFGLSPADLDVETRGIRGRTQHVCKVQPEDNAWPVKALWDVLDLFVSDLEKPLPLATPCYEGVNYNTTECAYIIANWGDSDLHDNHPTSVMSPLFTGLSCLPTSDPAFGACTQGTYPVYVVNARSVWDVQTAVNFARNLNLRLVIKNTGHDFAGKATGRGSLSIRTHLFQDIRFIKNHATSTYSGPVFKVGTGVQGRKLYKIAGQYGYAVVGGEGMTVGYAGGYIQGGGHSPLSSRFGMGADSVVCLEVVIANGRFVTASVDSHPDLFWALLGGGGSTFGVVVSITVKAHKDMPITISQFTFNASDSDLTRAAAGDMERKDFWQVVKTYMSLFPAHADQGIYSYFNIHASADGKIAFNMVPYFAPKKTVAEVNALLAPVVAKAEELGIALKPNTTAFSNYYDAWANGFPKEVIGLWYSQIGSRLFPRSNFEDTTKFDATWDAIKNQVNNNSYLIGFNIAPTLAAGGNPNSSVNPAWRNTVMHAITGARWNTTTRDLGYINSIRADFTNNRMQKWRDVSPGAGCYLGESDINEPNRQQAFWGTNYNRLYSIKQKYDPTGVFFAETSVGSENWTTGSDRLGRLCPV